MERNVNLSRTVLAAPEISPVVSTTPIWISSYLIPREEANSEVPGRGPIAESFNPVEPIVVFVYQSFAEEIAISVIDKCGYPLNLSGEEGILEFKNYYLSKDKDSTEKN